MQIYEWIKWIFCENSKCVFHGKIACLIRSICNFLLVTAWIELIKYIKALIVLKGKVAGCAQNAGLDVSGMTTAFISNLLVSEKFILENFLFVSFLTDNGSTS